jgi:hypothetical protein
MVTPHPLGLSPPQVPRHTQVTRGPASGCSPHRTPLDTGACRGARYHVSEHPSFDVVRRALGGSTKEPSAGSPAARLGPSQAIGLAAIARLLRATQLTVFSIVSKSDGSQMVSHFSTSISGLTCRPSCT